MSLSAIQAFFSGRSVLVTGATGFCGQQLLHKLISCTKTGNIFLLMRPTRTGGSIYQRLDQLLSEPLLATVSRDPGTNIVPINGDITRDGLGLSPDDRKRLCKEVSVVFHSAATVRFKEPLIAALDINLRGTTRVLDLCKDMEQLKSLVYLSTAYSNCHRSEIEERVYPPPVDPPTLERIYKKQVADQDVLGQWPNSYTFSKALTEHTLSTRCGDHLPVAIVRPSAVYASIGGPIPGWTSRFVNGPARVTKPVSKGLTRFILANGDKAVDLIPVDMTANFLIAAAWDIATQNPGRSGPKVYNFVSSAQNPITWREYFMYLRDAVRESPPSDAVHPCQLTLAGNLYLYLVFSFLGEVLPAYLKDSLAFITGKHGNVRKQRQVIDYCTMANFFPVRDWKFHNNNVQTLQSRMSKEDRMIFDFDLTPIDWRQYIKTAYDFTREHLNRDPPSTIPEARKRYRRLQILHRTKQAIFLATSLGLGSWGLEYL